MTVQGLIVKGVGGLYTVRTADGHCLTCRLRGRFRFDGRTPMVGDRVICTDDEGGRIDELLERVNSLVRPPLANLDTLLLVLSQAPPRSDPAMVDALTVAAEHNEVRVVIAVNKTDLADGSVWQRRFAATGYPVFCVSAATGEGVDALRDALKGQTVALAGHSGVGKSSLMNAVFPSLALQTGEISARNRLGRHTTRHVELLACDGCYVADTPGFSVFDASGAEQMTREQLAHCFPEFRDWLTGCRWRDCRHEKDDECAVLQALADGKINAERHASYVQMAAKCKR